MISYQLQGCLTQIQTFPVNIYSFFLYWEKPKAFDWRKGETDELSKEPWIKIFKRCFLIDSDRVSNFSHKYIFFELGEADCIWKGEVGGEFEVSKECNISKRLEKPSPLKSVLPSMPRLLSENIVRCDLEWGVRKIMA